MTGVDMFVNLLVTDRWMGRVNREELVDDAEWDEIEAAIRRLDGNVYTYVSIEKVLPESDANEGEINLSVGGGPERFLVTLSHPNQLERLATVSSPTTRQLELVIGGQGVAFPENVCVDLATALVAAREFADHGVAAAGIVWIDRQAAGP